MTQKRQKKSEGMKKMKKKEEDTGREKNARGRKQGLKHLPLLYFSSILIIFFSFSFFFTEALHPSGPHQSEGGCLTSTSGKQ